MEFVYVILALILGATAGFCFGVQVDPKDLKAQIEKRRRVSRQPADDATIVPGFVNVPPLPFPAAISDDVTFPAAHVGDVYISLWLPRSATPADVDVEILWGPHRATITLTALDNVGVALRLGKGVDTEDAVVRVNTTVPTCRFAGTQPATEATPVRGDLIWS